MIDFNYYLIDLNFLRRKMVLKNTIFIKYVEK